MKRLRVLTGLHAGVSVVLNVGCIRVGSHVNADLHMTDWTVADVMLTVPASGPVTVQSLPPAGQEADMAAQASPDRVLEDFMPERHGEVVFCVGPDGAEWPADVDLLQRLYLKDERHQRPRPRWRLPAVAGIGAMSCGLAMACAPLLISETGHALAPPAVAESDATLIERLRAELAQRGLTEIEIQHHASGLRLRGYVPTVAADTEVRDVIRTFGPGARIERHYRIARNDVQSLLHIVGQRDVRVVYMGGGRFRLSGEVGSLGEYRRALDQVSTELGLSSTQLLSEVTEVPAPAPTLAYTNLLSTGNVRYARTPDGIKHVFPAVSLNETE